MEKSAEYQYMVFKQDGKLLMRCPGGNTVPYDNRFSDCPNLAEGENFIKPIKEDA